MNKFLSALFLLSMSVLNLQAGTYKEISLQEYMGKKAIIQELPEAQESPNINNTNNNSPVLSTEFEIQEDTNNLEISETTGLDNSIPLLKGGAESIQVMPQKSEIEISLNSLVSTEFSAEGDPVEAKILIGRYVTDPSLIALRGARLRGNISNVVQSRSLGRNGRMEILFDSLELTSGDIIPIQAKMSTETFKGKEILNTLKADAKLITHGTVWGLVNSLRMAPVHAFATNGMSLLAGAGLGAGMGVIGSFRRDGESQTFAMGDNQQVKLNSPLYIPQDVIEQAEITKLEQEELNNNIIVNTIPGFDLRLNDIQVKEKIGDYNYTGQISVTLDNNSGRTISATDLILVPHNGDDPVVADLRLSQLELLKQVHTGQISDIILYYPIDLDINEYYLALIDPITKDSLVKMNLKVSKKNIESQPEDIQ